MPLSTGARLGVYEVTALIGEGGMGQVYRARDTKLNRDVALKILPDAFASDPDRLARFTREAQTLAALNHPNIAHIHGFEETGGVRALVMELVEGDDLSQRIARGAIPVAEALPIAKQIADALEAAHEQGIIHRDLKPANIKIRDDGTVKVLDFGLAKALEPAVGADASVTMSPTITTPAMTQMGLILGTAAYMSPEQAKGRPADKRSDIWALGCVVYEMLTGKRVFHAEDVSDTLAFVLTKAPDWTLLPASTPAGVCRFLRRSLEKDRKRRLADAADAKLEIEEAVNAGTATVLEALSSPAVGAGSIPTTRSHAWIAATVTLTVALVVSLVMWAPWTRVMPPAPLQLMAELGADVSVVNQGSAIILSPDGGLLAFVAPSLAGGPAQLYVRRLGQLQATALSGTAGARNPFFSPDGQWIGFFADDKLKKIAVTGGAAVTLCEARQDRGGAWAEDGSIFFAAPPQAPLSRVSSAGGQPEPATKLSDGEITQRWPQVLPGGKGLIYTSHSAPANFDDANIVVQPLPAGAPKIVQRGGYFGRYVASGHLLYIRQGTLFAVPFDFDRLEVTAHPVPVLEDVASGPSGVGANGAAQFAVSNTGTLIYLPGGSFVGSPIDWIDRTGKTTPLRRTPAFWTHPQFSPDGQRLAMGIFAGPQSDWDVWVYEWTRDSLARLTSGPKIDQHPIWTPDGRRIAFGSQRGSSNTRNVYWQRADGTGDVQRLTESTYAQYPASWHPSGKVLAFTELKPQSGFDLMILPLEGDETSGWKPGKPTAFLSSPFNEQEPMFSPDGRWLAYQSNESGDDEVYVRPFPGPGGKVLVSTAGGAFPTWSRAKRELLYQSPDRRIMVASYAVNGDSFVPDKPRPWSEQRFVVQTRGRSFDLHPDGERVALAVARDLSATKQDKLVFIFNFFDEIRRLAPNEH